MKINWKLRFQNKVIFWMIIGFSVSFIYQGLLLIGIIPTIDQQAILDWLAIGVELLCALGIVIDPTTPNTKDSDVAMAKNNVTQTAEEVILLKQIANMVPRQKGTTKESESKSEDEDANNGGNL
jgi:holin, phage phi LC3 family